MLAKISGNSGISRVRINTAMSSQLNSRSKGGWKSSVTTTGMQPCIIVSTSRTLFTLELPFKTKQNSDAHKISRYSKSRLSSKPPWRQCLEESSSPTEPLNTQIAGPDAISSCASIISARDVGLTETPNNLNSSRRLQLFSEPAKEASNGRSSDADLTGSHTWRHGTGKTTSCGCHSMPPNGKRHSPASSQGPGSLIGSRMAKTPLEWSQSTSPFSDMTVQLLIMCEASMKSTRPKSKEDATTKFRPLNNCPEAETMCARASGAM
mmetsp:Transcript_84249/g.212443  ORF Transcript_84249/g.212443 Transcript_84249/m.212443 type:complete len:265 (-) Transcript_84249:174-968(-)